MLLNLGPQHSGTHGIVRLVLRLARETIVDCTLIIGYVHRGIEKILENLCNVRKIEAENAFEKVSYKHDRAVRYVPIRIDKSA
jgi:NADH:ubiquinone oxidoreductase subunit D